MEIKTVFELKTSERTWFVWVFWTYKAWISTTTAKSRTHKPTAKRRRTHGHRFTTWLA